MNPHQLSPINIQLLALEREYGAEEASQMALRSVIELCSTAECSSWEVIDAIRELHQLAWNCRPKMATVIHDLQKLLVRVAISPTKSAKQHAEDLLLERKKRSAAIVHNAGELLRDAASVLIFAYSGTVFKCLEKAFASGARPKIWLTGGSASDCERMLNLFESYRVEYESVEPTTIAHIVEHVGLAIFGAVACTASEHLVVDAGTAALVTQLHEARVKTYATLATDKFSAWKGLDSAACLEAHHEQLVTRKMIRYAYSHDLVSCTLFTALITELGIIQPGQLRDVLACCAREFLERDSIIKA